MSSNDSEDERKRVQDEQSSQQGAGTSAELGNHPPPPPPPSQAPTPPPVALNGSAAPNTSQLYSVQPRYPIEPYQTNTGFHSNIQPHQNNMHYPSNIPHYNIPHYMGTHLTDALDPPSTYTQLGTLQQPFNNCQPQAQPQIQLTRPVQPFPQPSLPMTREELMEPGGALRLMCLNQNYSPGDPAGPAREAALNETLKQEQKKLLLMQDERYQRGTVVPHLIQALTGSYTSLCEVIPVIYKLTQEPVSRRVLAESDILPVQLIQSIQKVSDKNLVSTALTSLLKLYDAGRCSAAILENTEVLLSLIRCKDSTLSVVENVLRLLTSLLKDTFVVVSVGARKKLANEGCVKLILSILAKKQGVGESVPILVMETLSMLLTCEPRLSAVFSNEGGIAQVCRLLGGLSRGTIQCKTEGCKLLSLLPIEYVDRPADMKYAPVFNCLSEQDEGLKSLALKVISNFARKLDKLPDLVMNLCQLSHLLLSDVDVQVTRSAKSLVCFIKYNTACREKLVDIGGVPNLMDVLTLLKHEQSRFADFTVWRETAISVVNALVCVTEKNGEAADAQYVVLHVRSLFDVIHFVNLGDARCLPLLPQVLHLILNLTCHPRLFHNDLHRCATPRVVSVLDALVYGGWQQPPSGAVRQGEDGAGVLGPVEEGAAEWRNKVVKRCVQILYCLSGALNITQQNDAQRGSRAVAATKTSLIPIYLEALRSPDVELARASSGILQEYSVEPSFRQCLIVDHHGEARLREAYGAVSDQDTLRQINCALSNSLHGHCVPPPGSNTPWNM